MAKDYISREAALKAIYTSTAPALEVKLMPAADVVKARRGYWKPVSCREMFGGDPEAWYGHGDPIACHLCSKCNGYPPLDEYGDEILTNYCPDCGAKMEGWKWCVWQDEDNEGVYCTAHIHEDRVLNCPYKDLEERQRADYPCQDYRPMDGGQSNGEHSCNGI